MDTKPAFRFVTAALHVDLHGVIHRHNMRMFQSGRSTRFLFEVGYKIGIIAQRGAQHLQRDESIEFDVARFVDDRKAAATDLVQQFVFPDTSECLRHNGHSLQNDQRRTIGVGQR